MTVLRDPRFLRPRNAPLSPRTGIDWLFWLGVLGVAAYALVVLFVLFSMQGVPR